MKIINKFIVWYLKRHNAKIQSDGYIVHVYSEAFYNDIVEDALEKACRNL